MSGLPILAYHALDDSGSVVATSPSRFAATLRALHGEGFTCVDLGDWIEAGRPTVERGFGLTFDDGYASIRVAAESLARFGFTATAFLVTGHMGLDNAWDHRHRGIPIASLLRWGDLNDLRAAGFRFGAHTETHPQLSKCDWGTMVREILGSRREIEVRTGETCRLFAYPYGDTPRPAIEIVANSFSAGFGTRLGYASKHEDVGQVSRVDAYYLRTEQSLRALIAGQWEATLRTLRLARAVKQAIAVA